MTDVLSRARSYLMSGDAGRAFALLSPLAAPVGAHSDVLTLYGYALMALGRRDDAEAAFRRCIEVDPNNRNGWLRMAAVLADNNKPFAAEKIARADIGKDGWTVDAAFVLARALLGQARLDEAEREFRAVVRADPRHQVAQANLMELVWTRTGDIGKAADSLDKLLQMDAHLSWPRIVKARLLVSAGMPQEALSILENGLAADPIEASLLVAATAVALELDADLGLRFATRAVHAAPGAHAALTGLGNALLATGQAGRALAIADELLNAGPVNNEALAMRADALRMLGDARYLELMDYNRFVRAEKIDAPDGWPSLDAYLSELAVNLVPLHAQRMHPVGNSLRGGSQVQLIPEQSPSAAVRAFPRAIDGPIRRYIQAIGAGPRPMQVRNTGRYAFNGMWSVRLRAKGFHVTHYHPKGWISSAFYLRLPQAVKAGGGEGWLKFGEPGFAMQRVLQPEYFVKPERGLLVLFPSYMWHGTVPFSGDTDESRLTIAFDVIPR